MGKLLTDAPLQSKYFTWDEVFASDIADRRGIDNFCYDYRIQLRLEHTAKQMDKVRELLGSPVLASSWYRSPLLNVAVGSNSRSQHPAGEAVDFRSPRFGTPLKICIAIITSGISYDQLILEHSWVHISFKNPASANRNQVLSLLANKKYAPGLTDKKGNVLWTRP